MKFSSNTTREADINLTPLIDVVFLLLIFFMVSTQFASQSAINVRLPTAMNADAENSAEAIELYLSRNREVEIFNKKFSLLDRPSLLSYLKESVNGEKGKSTVLIINADLEVDYQSIIILMDVAREAGLVKVSLATKRSDS